MNPEQFKNLTQAADLVFEKYSFLAKLHVMSGWHIKKEKNILKKDIQVTFTNEEQFQDAEFFLQFDENFNIVACYTEHKSHKVGESITFLPHIPTNAIRH